jgi:hypothetical protein
MLRPGRAEAPGESKRRCGGLGPARQEQRRKNNVLVGVPFSKNLEDRLDQDQEVKPEAPIINIP